MLERLSPQISNVFKCFPSVEEKTVEKWVKRGAILSLAVGTILLVGAVLGFLGAHGVLPQTLLSQHRWTLLAVGLGFILIGSLGGLYLKTKDDGHALIGEKTLPYSTEEYNEEQAGVLAKKYGIEDSRNHKEHDHGHNVIKSRDNGS